jgi:PAS domain S-box-containing protein
MASILLVDDRPANLLALAAILGPLGQELVTAGSGDEALRILLGRDDFAVILLDVQMPKLDGFETATLIKQRERTKNIPIIFLTAISKEEQNVFRGYEVGAVDYVFKPFDAGILRSKVAVFIELYDKSEQLRRQTELLALQELADLRRESAERYRQLADAMPQIVWTADREGRPTYYNERWFDYTGLRSIDMTDDAWARVTHPDDLPAAMARRAETLVSGAVFEVEYRFRAGDGSYRWHLGRAVPIRDEDGEIDFWIGTATDIDDRKRIEETQRFLLDAGVELSRSLDFRSALDAVARLAVPRIADWCAIHVVEPDGQAVQVALVHLDAALRVLGSAEAIPWFAARGSESSQGPGAVIATGRAQFVPEVTDALLAELAADEAELDLSRQLGVRSYLSVPMVARGRMLGVITLAEAESGRRLGEDELRLAEELAQRAATAVDNARLYEEAERRARAARALQTIADGVALVDRAGVVLLWNAAAETITGLAAADVVGQKAAEAVPGYAQVVDRVALDGSRPETFPVEVGNRELWLSFSGVEFEDGRVYAFRDLTEERAIEQLRSDFVATVSHELRTPLAAIYGAAVTIRRPDLTLTDDLRDRLLVVIEDESSRLAEIINDVLVASHLDSGQLRLNVEPVDPAEVTKSVVEAAQIHLPDGITVSLEQPRRLPAVQADPKQLRQVLVNLLENAVKYSPDGGQVKVELMRTPDCVQWSVSDRGLGIPPGERRRIFEKFYRLDPQMTRGIGGTGLGLYICRELVRRLDGRIWVDANGDKGSVFQVQIPIANGGAGSKARQREAA